MKSVPDKGPASGGKLKTGNSHKHNVSKPGIQKQAGKDDGGLSKHTYKLGDRSYNGSGTYSSHYSKGGKVKGC